LQQLRCVIGVTLLCNALRCVAVDVFKQRVCSNSKQMLHNVLLRRSVMQCCFAVVVGAVDAADARALLLLHTHAFRASPTRFLQPS